MRSMAVTVYQPRAMFPSQVAARVMSQSAAAEVSTGAGSAQPLGEEAARCWEEGESDSPDWKPQRARSTCYPLSSVNPGSSVWRSLIEVTAEHLNSG